MTVPKQELDDCDDVAEQYSTVENAFNDEEAAALVLDEPEPPVVDNDIEFYDDDEDECNGVDNDNNDEYEYVELTEDIYSFLLVSRPASKPFIFASVVFGFQSVLFILILVDIIELGTDNPLQIPPGVTKIVSAAQFLLLPLAVAVEADMIASLIMFHNGYDKAVMKIAKHATHCNWLLACTLKFAGGALALITNFILMIQSSSVVDMFLNFAALGMVSSSSAVAFALAKQGFVSNALQKAAVKVHDIKYPKKPGSNLLRRTFFLAILLALVAGWSVFFHWQKTGKYLCGTLALQFGDEFNADLAGFSGTYQLVPGKKIAGRVVYTDVKSERAMLAYCEEYKAWTFTYSSRHSNSTGGLDPCQYEAISPETLTYDITDISPSDWFVGNANADREPVPFQFVSLICFECEESDVMTCTDSGRQCKPGMYGLHCQFSIPCASLDASPGTRFMYNRNSRMYEGFWLSGEFFSPLVVISDAPHVKGNSNTHEEAFLMVNERPVFAYEYRSDIDYEALGLADQTGFFEMIFFTGRRWVLTTSEELRGLNTTTNGRTDVQRLAEYFETFHSHFSDYGAFYISDPTDYGTPTETGTPERLSWYKVAPGTNNKVETSLESDVVLLCSCDNDEYPCFEGVCTERVGAFNFTYSACECVQGFGGSLCQKQCNEGFTGYNCDEQICGARVACNSGGSCMVSEGVLNSTKTTCDCPQGYGGTYCDYACPPGYEGFDCDVKFCTAEEPCRNGGECTMGTSDSTVPYSFRFCDCPQAFGGSLCEKKCADGFSGIACDRPICSQDVPCLNGGVCEVRTGVSNTTANFCSCDQGFGGPLCDRQCPPGFSGYDCKDTHCGAEFPCDNNGTCETSISDAGTAFTFCQCLEGYGGAFCEDQCPPGYTGLFCDEVACSRDSPCRNSGTCKVRTGDTGSTFRFCSCPVGFGGAICEDECPPGFTGLFCNERTCGKVFPCENGGVCEEVEDGPIVSYTFCNCTVGFGGFFCGETCPYGFTGPFCDDQVPCSDEIPCLNEGTCIEPTEDSNETSCVCREGYGGAFCDLQCPPGFTGTSCLEIANCAESGDAQCLNDGVCVEDDLPGTRCDCPLGFGGFLCDIACDFGYTGYYCDQLACSPAFPCFNNGTCSNGTQATCSCLTGFGGFFCEDICRYGYSGMNCDERLLCSSSLPCLNGGTCKELNLGSSGNSTFCECRHSFGGTFCEVKCPFGYTGTYCDQRASCNDDLPCLNEGICKVQEEATSNVTFSSCECPPGFGGSLCQTRCPLGYTGSFCDVPAE